jgi:hypothetical protein
MPTPARHADLAGAPPQMASITDLTTTPEMHSGRPALKRKAKRPNRINLTYVAEACAEAGLDPSKEIVRILQAKRVVTDRSGAVVVNPDGTPVTEDMIDPDTKLRTLNELLGYVQPKLKAVAVKVSGALDLSTEQLDKRLSELLEKAA